jgi:hypothetical protein
MFSSCVKKDGLAPLRDSADTVEKVGIVFIDARQLLAPSAAWRAWDCRGVLGAPRGIHCHKNALRIETGSGKRELLDGDREETGR